MYANFGFVEFKVCVKYGICIAQYKGKNKREVVLTTMMQGPKKNQYALHHSQKKKLLFPIIISMSSFL